MQIVRYVLQIIVALGLLNVWLLRFRQSTAYRGGDAHSMQEEFAFYGLPVWFMYFIGALKIGAAICLLAGLWLHALVSPAALLVFVLMCGALAMHIKVRDSLKKSLPAVLMLVLNLSIYLLARR